MCNIGDTIAGPIMKASTAAKRYGGGKVRKGKSGTYKMKDSSGNFRDVPAGADVYHRGKGNFAVYSVERDRAIPARSRTAKKHLKPKQVRVGAGNYRHLHD